MKFIVLISIILAYLNSSKQPVFVDNTIGVAQVIDTSYDSIQFRLIVPIQNLSGYKINNWNDDVPPIIGSIKYNGTISFYDETGLLVDVAGEFDFDIRFWCENDGGIQYRPELIIQLPKSSFDRKLNGHPLIENIACFVLLNKNPNHSFNPIDDNIDIGKVIMKVDLDSNGMTDVAITITEDETGLCINSILLISNDNISYLNCCGP